MNNEFGVVIIIMLNLISMQHQRDNVHLPGIPGGLSKEEEAWVEPEKVDEGLEPTRTASGGCLDWSVAYTGLASCTEKNKPFYSGKHTHWTSNIQSL